MPQKYSMGDRDIPTVPVTTLSGLTSTSDLLSELPVSDSLQSAASLNKSLLFHALVASESNNLLSVRDENLVRQLVKAIERTNSDNIELRSHYANEEQGANSSTHPELLQGIYNFRPAVFETSIRTLSPDKRTVNVRLDETKIQLDSFLTPKCCTSTTREELLQDQQSQTCSDQFTRIASREMSEEFSQINIKETTIENRKKKTFKILMKIHLKYQNQILK
uniref:Nipped-B protein-like isoform X1 n=2 Tax=Drosophila rhopaloa TaxID=1041015 RepID=A0A6P4ENJ0_DRORH